jgi:hypothetical protein
MRVLKLHKSRFRWPYYYTFRAANAPDLGDRPVTSRTAHRTAQTSLLIKLACGGVAYVAIIPTKDKVRDLWGARHRLQQGPIG